MGRAGRVGRVLFGAGTGDRSGAVGSPFEGDGDRTSPLRGRETELPGRSFSDRMVCVERTARSALDRMSGGGWVDGDFGGVMAVW